jgi:hypothetical protein
MVMVIHEQVRVDLHFESLAQLPKELHKMKSISVIAEDVLALVPTSGDMTPPPGRSIRKARAISNIQHIENWKLRNGNLLLYETAQVGTAMTNNRFSNPNFE